MKSELPWSLRQRLLAETRKDFARYGDSAALGDILSRTLFDVARATRSAPLRTFLKGARSRQATLDGWVAEMPKTHRAEWLVERLTDAGGFVWASEPPTRSGPLVLPLSERAKIELRFEREWEQAIDRTDDPPDTERYGDALADELDRIGAHYEELAVRLLKKRFFDDHGDRTLTFYEAFVRSKLVEAGAILRFVERKLGIEWSTPEPAAAPARQIRDYTMGASYEVGDRIAHPKFGEGTVVATSAGKVQVRFGDAVRVLASG